MNEDDLKKVLDSLNLDEDETKVDWKRILRYFESRKKIRADNDEEDTCKL